MTRLPFWGSSSPFLLSATVQHHLKGVTGKEKQAADRITSTFIVYDLLTGAESEEDALRLFYESKNNLEDGQNCRDVYRKRRSGKGVQVEVGERKIPHSFHSKTLSFGSPSGSHCGAGRCCKSCSLKRKRSGVARVGTREKTNEIEPVLVPTGRFLYCLRGLQHVTVPVS